MSNLEHVGWRCTECGRMERMSNQPCTEHGDVEPVYRVAGAIGGDQIDSGSGPMTFLTPRQIKVLRTVFEEALGSREPKDPEFDIINALRDQLYP